MAASDVSNGSPPTQPLLTRLGSKVGLSAKHLVHASAGVAACLALTAGLLAVAWQQYQVHKTSDVALHAVRSSLAASLELAQSEAAEARSGPGAGGSRNDQARHHRAEFQRIAGELLAGLQPLPRVGQLAVQLDQQTHEWLTESAAGAAPRAPTAAVANASAAEKSLAEALHFTLAAVLRECTTQVEVLQARELLLKWLQVGQFVLLGGLAVAGTILVNSATSEYFRARLRKSESALAQTHSIITTTQDGVLVLDDQGHIQSINPAGEKMFAQAAHKLLGQSVSLLIPQRLFMHDASNVTRGSFMAMGQRQGYYPFPIEISLSELKIDGRRQYCALIRDVAERKRGEETLKHIGIGVSAATGEQFVRSLLRQLSKALSFNYAFLIEIIGDGPNSVATLTLAEKGEVRATASIDLQNTACAEVLAKGFRAVTSGARQQYPEDTMLADCEANAFVAMPLADYRGRPVGVMGVLDKSASTETEIIESTLQIFATRAAAEIERKRSEEALAAEKERLVVTLRSIGDGCMTLDNDGKVIMLNPVGERLTGWSQEKATGKPLSDVLHLLDERTRRRCQHVLQRIAQNGHRDDVTAPNILVAQDGSERLVESSSAPIRDRAGRKVGVVIVLRDVTERHRLEEERQKAEKLESLGLVAGGIAHDFNNILTTILGNITLTLKAGLHAPLNERLTSACQATHRAKELAGQLLTFAKGGVPIKQPTDLGRLLSDTTQCTLAGSKTVCDLQFAAGLWPVEADPGQLAQVIASLTSNADQAMPSGGVIHLTAENLESVTDGATLRDGRWVRFSVKDHGVGIQEQYLTKIFDPYFTTKAKGSGLGLATAYSIVKNHGGFIQVESAPGVGSTFSVCLPATHSEALLPPAAKDETPAPVPSGSGRVLILDDEEAICMLVTCALEPLGYEVTETQDGLVALAKYEEAMQQGRRYDLVISDLTMPGRMSGHEAIQRLRALDPDVRAIVSSGYANDPVMSQHEEYGFCGMIAKPYEIDALGRKVGEVLGKPLKKRVIYHSFEQRKTA